MPKLYYCNTCYDCNPPLDINPLILRKHKNDKILALCARDRMVYRITFHADKAPYILYPNQEIVAVGWWELHDFGLHSTKSLYNYDVVVIIGKDRIDPIFHGALAEVEKALCSPSTPSA